MSSKVMKSNVGKAFTEKESFIETDFTLNFADFKPGRPENHKAEFKKRRESLQMKGRAEFEPEASKFQDMKPKRPTINRFLLFIVIFLLYIFLSTCLQSIFSIHS